MSELEQKWMFLSSDDIFLCWSYFQKETAGLQL